MPPVRLLWLLAFLLPSPVRARPETSLDVKPGPRTISAEEAALAPDGKTGAVVLLEEQSIDEQFADRVLRFHLRAKILTNDGRALANVVIPYIRGEGKIKDWWARTLLPDGKVIELPLEQAVEHTAMKVRGAEWRELRAALPAVVPGAVIDYGYVLHSGRLDWYNRVDLQREYPIRTLRLRWRPTDLLQGAYRVYGPDLAIKITKDKGSILVVGSDLPPLVEEPYMPPAYHLRASVGFYYIDPEDDPDHFWDDQARKEERFLVRFLSPNGPLRELVDSWKLSPEMALDKKLEHAYHWVTENVKDTGGLSFEELAAADKEGKESFNAKQVLKGREGDSWQLAALFVGLARTLGAEAYLALVTDRRHYFWDASLLSMEPFEDVLAAVRAPGQGDEAFVVSAPGSGLAYGQVPWWSSGTQAMLLTSRGSRTIRVPASDYRKNVSASEATFTFDEEGAMHVAWTRDNKNLRGFELRRYLKDLDTHARQERLQDLCGATHALEISQADSPGLEEKFGTLHLRCVGDAELTGPAEEDGRYTMLLDGPWIEPLPDFEGRAERVHPVVFDYGRVDSARLTVEAPPGFVPKSAPKPRGIDSDYGRYRRTVQLTERGYLVERHLSFTPLVVPAQEYVGLRAFLDLIRQADQVPLEFERKQEAE